MNLEAHHRHDAQRWRERCEAQQYRAGQAEQRLARVRLLVDELVREGVLPEYHLVRELREVLAADTCPECSGWGHRLYISLADPDEALDKEPCARCSGTGRVGGAA